MGRGKRGIGKEGEGQRVKGAGRKESVMRGRRKMERKRVEGGEKGGTRDKVMLTC